MEGGRRPAAAAPSKPISRAPIDHTSGSDGVMGRASSTARPRGCARRTAGTRWRRRGRRRRRSRSTRRCRPRSRTGTRAPGASHPRARPGRPSPGRGPRVGEVQGLVVQRHGVLDRDLEVADRAQQRVVEPGTVATTSGSMVTSLEVVVPPVQADHVEPPVLAALEQRVVDEARRRPSRRCGAVGRRSSPSIDQSTTGSGRSVATIRKRPSREAA